MDPAVILLLVFMVYSALLGVCLARMRAINREFDTMKQIMVTMGNVQRDASRVETPKTMDLSPELLDALRVAMDGGVNG